MSSGRNVIVALRPEHVRLLAESDPCHLSEKSVPAKIAAVEALGWETHVWLDSEVGACVLREPAGTQRQRGESVRVALDLARASLFDATTGQRL